MKNHVKKLAFLTLLLLPVSPAFAYDEAFWEAMAKRPDVEIKKRVDGQRIAHFKSGVEIHESGKEWDNSGLGAVKCYWDMYVAAKNGLTICKPGTSNAHLDYAMEKTKAFIIANNLTPITAEDLDADMAKKFEKDKKFYDETSDIRREQMCTTSPPIAIEKALSAIPLDQFKQAIDKTLSVPRPPVDKPSCM